MITYIKKNFVFLFIAAFGLILGLTNNSFAFDEGAGGGTLTPTVLNKNGNLIGGPTLGQFELAPKVQRQRTASFPVSTFFGRTMPQVLRVVGSSLFDFLTVQQDASVKMLYAGFTQLQQQGGGPLFMTESSNSKLQVNGSIQVKALANPTAPALAPVCVNDAGIFTRTCPGGSGIEGL